MPQITIEYSRNMESRTDMRVLATRVHDAARATGMFRKGYGIRTRLEPRDDVVIADGDPENAFVAVMLRIAEGRSEGQRAALGQAIFDIMCDELSVALAETNLALSLEVQEIAAAFAFNRNNLHERLAAKHAASA